MSSQARREIDDLARCLRAYGPVTFHSLLAALIIWLFGVLVFIPIASSINWQTELLCSLIIFMAFTIFMCRAVPNLKKLIDAFSVFPARKYGLKRGMRYENSITLFRNSLYIISSLVIYALYFPLLMNVHPAISGIVSILILIWILFLTLEILIILLPKILGWFQRE